MDPKPNLLNYKTPSEARLSPRHLTWREIGLCLLAGVILAICAIIIVNSVVSAA